MPDTERTEAPSAGHSGGSSATERVYLFEPQVLGLALLVAVLGAIIGLELITRIGISPNSSIIAAVAAIAVSRVPIRFLSAFRNIHRQNLVQTTISGATYGAANGMLLPIGVAWLMGGAELVPAMLFGSFCGLVIDASVLIKIFDTKLFPAKGLWPPGVATAQCIIAADRGGQQARLLGVGGVVGAVGQFVGIPMDVFGVCWIGNIWALTMFGLGLLARGYSPQILGVELDKIYVPHGIMIGAGLVALGQIAALVLKKEHANDSVPISRASDSLKTLGTDNRRSQSSREKLTRGLGSGYVAFAVASGVMAVMAGVVTGMSPSELLLFVGFAAFAALTTELIAGIAAMHSGWFPAFATALIFLMVGMAMGFQPLALAFLVGFTSSTGPAFADMAYDLKAGWILRGEGKDPDFERHGRRQQYLAELLGFVVAATVVWFFHQSYFERNLFAPVNHVFVATIQAGAAPELARSLILWAIPGALLQLLGGPARQIGVLFATGLLINYPAAGWAALASLGIRAILERRYGNKAEEPMYVLAGGFIAGSAMTSFTTATLRVRS